VTKQTEKAAAESVPSWVSPSACFITYVNNKEGWQVIPGTPCAHYVAHQLDLRKSTGFTCNKGYYLRVRELVAVLNEIDQADVQLNDVWASLKGSGGSEAPDHCGVVSAVERGRAGELLSVTITHNSSRQKKVASNDWKQYFKGSGKFYRKPAGQETPNSASNALRLQSGLPYRDLRAPSE
jgi:hypothetical protein